MCISISKASAISSENKRVFEVFNPLAYLISHRCGDPVKAEVNLPRFLENNELFSTTSFLEGCLADTFVCGFMVVFRLLQNTREILRY